MDRHATAKQTLRLRLLKRPPLPELRPPRQLRRPARVPPELGRAPQVVEHRHLAAGGADGRELRLVAAEHSGPLASQFVGRLGHPVRRLQQVAAAAYELENVRPVRKSNGESGAPDNSPLSPF